MRPSATALFPAESPPAARCRPRRPAIPPGRLRRAVFVSAGQGKKAIEEAVNPGSTPPLPAVSSRGKAKERKAATGRAPMAARSLSPRAKARWPTASGGCQSRRKCLPATDKSVVTASVSPCFTRKSAQSSPIPSTSPAFVDRAARRRMRSIRASSPLWPFGVDLLCLTRILLRIGQAAERCGLVHYLWPM